MQKAMLRPTPPSALRASPRINGSAAPVCPTSRSQAIPPQPPVRRPGLPKVNDLPSVINTLNQIINIINNEWNDPQDFQEKTRGTEIVRIYNPNDHEQWVDVERINYLRLDDEVTGGHIIWKY
jgi:hypothetical protein